MSAVVLRCPHCGTTQGSPGECESCHEAEVRPFCPNHTPGRWLDGPTCPECGAAIGRDRPTPPRASPPPPVSPRYRREAPRDVPRDVPREPRREALREPPWRPPREPEPTRREPEPPRRREPFGTPYTPPRESPGASEWPPPPAWRPEPPPAVPPMRPPARERPPRAFRVSVFGCVGRLVATAIFLLVLLALAFFWLFGSGGGFTSSVVDFGRQVGVVAGTPEQTARGVEAFRAGDYERAERELREAAQAYPRSGVALVYLARIARTRGDEVRAIEQLEDALRREPDLAIAHRELAALYLARGQRMEAAGASDFAVVAEMTTAERHFARAVELDPADRTARGYRACALVALGRDGEAATERAAAGEGPWSSCAGGVR